MSRPSDLAAVIGRAAELKGKRDPASLAAVLRLWGLDDLNAAAAMLDLFDKVYEALPPCEHCPLKSGRNMQPDENTEDFVDFGPCSCAATDHPGKMDPAEFIDRLLATWEQGDDAVRCFCAAGRAPSGGAAMSADRRPTSRFKPAPSHNPLKAPAACLCVDCSRIVLTKRCQAVSPDGYRCGDFSHHRGEHSILISTVFEIAAERAQ